MKHIISMLVCLFMLGVQAQNNTFITQEVKVRGNCGQCKTRIEKAVNQKEVSYGTWDIQSKILTLHFNPEKTSLQEVMQKVADVGHDNEYFKSKDTAYDNITPCCKYDREIPWEKIAEATTAHHGEHPQEMLFKYEKEDSQKITLQSVTASGNTAATKIDKNAAGLSFNISSKELLKAACCNLSESFETNATVDVAYPDAVTGAKQIKMLGLDQKYTLLSSELIPDLRGLSGAYGLNFIPGRWIQGIQLTKGGSSVVHGYESITGQINTEWYKGMKKQNNLNFYANLMGRVEGNAVLSAPLGEHWGQAILLHASAVVSAQDDNKDTFIDTPLGKQLNMAYLLHYDDLANSGWGNNLGINLVSLNNSGGQMAGAVPNPYKANTEITNFKVWDKLGYLFPKNPYKSLGLMQKFSYYEQKSIWGANDYSGVEKSYYANLIYESPLSRSRVHTYKTGASFLYDAFDETYQGTHYQRTESAPGVFAEYSYNAAKWTVVAGARLDFHNLAGTQFSPRINAKFQPLQHTTLRASAGRGFRTANIFAENLKYLISNRTLRILDQAGDIYGLSPEEAWNYGVSIQQEFRLFNQKNSLLLDFFATNFQNQIIPDLDASTHQINFYNIAKSSAQAWQIQWDSHLARGLDLRVAYKHYNTKAQYQSGEKSLIFTPKERAFANISYEQKLREGRDRWSADATLQWVGRQRLPNSAENPEPYRWEQYSPSYFLLNAQVAYDFGKAARVYLGGENLLNYTQSQPIIAQEAPFGEFFDAGMIYAPITKANFYIGLDFNF
ncbi:TonB-dependent receptor [Ornithobacterium rhinotracheale]|uniref:TonB-dependent receptor n=1 Tax=Ornithobacterium rhinotracheale TaxID=28251 RepID=A0A3R6ATB8_ORNRH|nr:TonB-dependent receptor [Ornithobacterium rhinotracheale]QAR30165.1 TonB-dependent receptor [Ornithobacterium rhinotracheale]